MGSLRSLRAGPVTETEHVYLRSDQDSSWSREIRFPLSSKPIKPKSVTVGIRLRSEDLESSEFSQRFYWLFMEDDGEGRVLEAKGRILGIIDYRMGEILLAVDRDSYFQIQTIYWTSLEK